MNRRLLVSLLGGISFLGIALGVLLSDVSSPCSGAFDELCRLSKERSNEDRCRSLASEMMNTTQGVHCALSDMCVTGGRSRGWANWMLMMSDCDIVTAELERVGEDKTVHGAMRVEAYIILCKRGPLERHVAGLFELVKSPGGREVSSGRGYLATLGHRTNRAVQAIIDDTHYSQPLPMSSLELIASVFSNRSVRAISLP